MNSGPGLDSELLPDAYTHSQASWQSGREMIPTTSNARDCLLAKEANGI